MARTKGEQTTVRIPVGMKQAINEFLQTEEAKQMGLDSQADVISQALREFLKVMGHYQRRFGVGTAEKDTKQQ